MKNQYFGDNKDLFTYDLIYHIMQSGLASHFTFIPMLTSNNDKGHGAKNNRDKARAGTRNKDLMGFLDSCVRENKRDIRQLESFFAGYGIKMTIYAGKDGYFSHQQRQQYFDQIGEELLTGALIFVDPDVGLEVTNSGEQHILYNEVKSLYERMDEDSILMLFQHFPHVEHHEYLHRRAEELTERISGDEPICVDDNKIIFFFLTKNEALEQSLTHLIQEYAESYS